jgi:OFA family oxalate/formate antiporter-like MFS transporter
MISEAEFKKIISPTERTSYRWFQLFLGIICMIMVANLQYGWTLFVNPMSAKYGWEKAAIQLAFTIFVLTETWLIPIEGYIVDKVGPKPMILVGGVLVGIAWILNSIADSLPMLYFAQAVGGVGAGAVYGTCVGNALKWFPDRRGLAAGMTAAGFGMGSALTIIPISAIIQSDGYESAFLYFGIIQGLVIIVCSFGFGKPKKN